MKIIVCYKIAPDEQDFNIKTDRTISMEKAEWKIGQYDLNAVEAGVTLAADGGNVYALSVGGRELENSKLKKNILSRGPEALGQVIDEKLQDADPHTTARALADAIRAWQPDFDLVLCGEGSADLYAQQIGQQVGELLNVPAFNAVSSITLESESILIERSLEDEVELLSVMTPAVISVTTDINQPRIPSLKDILAAGQKPVETILITQSERAALEALSTLAPKPSLRRCVIIEGDSEDKVEEFLNSMQKELGR
jgi:electron transfer flavoprotein beta subunit